MLSREVSHSAKLLAFDNAINRSVLDDPSRVDAHDTQITRRKEREVGS